MKSSKSNKLLFPADDTLTQIELNHLLATVQFRALGDG
jgi:hypothetical protein